MLKAREMMSKLYQLEQLSEEMADHVIPAGMPQGFPSNYRGLAKVTKMMDGGSKNWLGIDMPFFIDIATGESNLLLPNGQMASVSDIAKVAHLEVFEPTPQGNPRE